MKPVLTISARAVGLAGALLAAPLAARADDCATITSAMIAQAKVPYAISMAMSKPDTTVDHTESVVTGTKLYFQMNGAWRSIPYSGQETIDQITKVAKESKVTCAKVGAETVDSVAASIYTAHVENGSNVSDNRIWISDRSGLPVKTETHFQDGRTIAQAYRYDNVQPPPGAQEQN